LQRILIFPVFIFLLNFWAAAQDGVKLLNTNILYNNPKEIINGFKWIPDKTYSGNPLLVKNYWPKAEITYNGKQFPGFQMNYDVLKDEVIIFDPDKVNPKYVVIDRDKVASFSFPDSLTGQKHFYQRIQLFPEQEKAVYEKVVLNKIQLFIRPLKLLKSTSETPSGKIADAYNYYIDLGMGLKYFSSKKQFLKIISNHRIEMKKQIRKENLIINTRHPEDVIAAIKYLESLN
jgi:hypothetical protein